MKSSIGKDQEDIKWEQRRIDRSDGQLETQIREAKLLMINQRISSKTVKLEDMLKTQKELLARLEKEKLREEKREAERKRKEQIKQEKINLKDKIQEDIKTAEKEREKDFEKASKRCRKDKIS